MPIAAGLAPAEELPEWAPTPWNIADYIPHRTLERVESSTRASEDTYYLTFTPDTRPTGDAVTRLIADNLGWVRSRLVPLHETAQGAARLVVCLATAAAIERAWPEDDYALQRANDMEKRMNDILAGLVISNDLANGVDPDNPDDPDDGLDVVPVWSFPPADRRFDSSNYF